MASAMRWGLAIVVGFLVLQFGGVLETAMELGAAASALLTLLFFGGAVWLGMVVLDRGD